MRPKVGDLVSGKYRLVRVIGDGGMGTVFEARHEYLGTAVALKFLHPELTQRAGLVQRFLQEARLSAGIRSHHIAHVTDVDQGPGGEAYLVMELLQGDSLQTVLDRERRLPVDTALDYTLQILAGLDAAHALGVVHRDLKPDNVFIVATPRGPLVKLLDFGIAKLRSTDPADAALTKPGTIMGTPEYMAPEQAYSSDAVDARADVYATGAILYEMILGKRPAPGDDPLQIAAFVIGNNVVRMTSVDPSVPAPLADVVHRAMAPLPGDRFSSAAALRDALVPFCRTLSLAGKLAATPAPSGVNRPADEVSGVAPTLPPDDEGAFGVPGAANRLDAGPGRQAGERPPSERVQPRSATQAAEPFEPGPWDRRPAGERDKWGSTEAAGSPPYIPFAPGAAPPYAPPPGGASPLPHGSGGGVPASATRAPSRRRRRSSGWLLGIMLVAAMAVAAVVIATSKSSGPARRAEVDPTTAPAPSGALPPANVAAPAPVQAPIPPPVQPPAAPARAPARPASKPPNADAAVGGATEAGTPPAVPGVPQGPFPLPSAWPFPLPSALPSALPFPLPSAFPPFTLPGFPQPTPAPSN